MQLSLGAFLAGSDILFFSWVLIVMVCWHRPTAALQSNYPAGHPGPSSIRLPESLTLTALPSISPQTVTRHLHSPSLSQPLQSDWHISFNAPPCFYLLPRNLDGFLRGSWAREPAVFPAEISTSGEEEREPPPHPHFSRKSQEALIS